MWKPSVSRETDHETQILSPSLHASEPRLWVPFHRAVDGDFHFMSKQPNRAPAFLFYADDFLSGTSDMSAEEVGGYVRLLCHQWAKGGLPNDEARLGRMAGLMGSPSLAYVVAKFTLYQDGQLRHPRLEALRSERDAFIIGQVNAGKKGAEARWKNRQPNGDPIADPNGKPMAPPMANEWPEDGSPSPTPPPDTKTPPNAGAHEPPSDLAVELPPGFPTSEAAAQFASVSVGCPESFAAEEWHRAMSRGGRDHRDIPIRSWASYLRTCWNHNNNRKAEEASRPPRPFSNPRRQPLPATPDDAGF